MNMEETIEVIISPDGSCQVKVLGIKGSSCKEITAELENLLGERLEVKLTEEYFANDKDISLQQTQTT